MANAMYRHYIINKKDVEFALAMGMTILQAYDYAICENPANDWHYAHDGYAGDVWEFGCSYYLNSGNIIRKCIASASSDAKVCGERFEIKSACGELPAGNKWQYVIYTAEVDFAQDPRTTGAVFTREEWDAFINGYAGRGQFLRWDANREKGHIQSFRSTTRPKASAPMRRYIDDCCKAVMSLGKFLGA